MPLHLAHQFGLPALWFLQVNRWADIATKEKYFGGLNHGMNYNLLLVAIIGVMLLAAYIARGYEKRNQ